jgi:Cu/Ag efflux pump CusA
MQRLLIDASYYDPLDLHHSLHDVQVASNGLLLILANVAMARVGGLLALADYRHTILAFRPAWVSWRLFGVSVQTGVIMLEYINQLRARAIFHRGRRR